MTRRHLESCPSLYRGPFPGPCICGADERPITIELTPAEAEAVALVLDRALREDPPERYDQGTQSRETRSLAARALVRIEEATP